MAYPVEMQESIRKVEASRGLRIGQGFPKLQFAEKAKLLETYHPDFRMTKKEKSPSDQTKEVWPPKNLWPCSNRPVG